MNYIVQVPTAKRICKLLMRDAKYESMVDDVAFLMPNDADLAEEYAELILHAEMCKQLRISPCAKYNLMSEEVVSLVKDRCLQFYYEESMIDEFLACSNYTRDLFTDDGRKQKDTIGICTSYNSHYLRFADALIPGLGDLSWLK